MSFEDRRAIVATVEETYALMGRALSTDVPGRVVEVAVRREVIEQLVAAEVDDYVTDEEMRDLLRTAYFDLVENVVRIHDELLGAPGDGYDAALPNVGLTGHGRELKVGGFRRALGRVVGGVPGFRWLKKSFEWADIILGSLGTVPIVGHLSDPIKELKESVEAQGNDDQGL